MAPGRVSVRMYLALRTVLVSNTVLLLIVETLLARFMEWPAGLVGAGATCVLAGLSLGAARWTDRLYDRQR
ncbi:MAG: hypothetical protein ACXV0U_06390 [Kineosporiaceae bacterium]